jgi:hypothetical protein
VSDARKVGCKEKNENLFGIAAATEGYAGNRDAIVRTYLANTLGDDVRERHESPVSAVVNHRNLRGEDRKECVSAFREVSRG